MQLNARIKHKRDTASNWATKNPTPLDGEIIIVEATDGTTRLKVGDGSTKYASLPFVDEALATQVSANTSNISTLTNTKVTGVTSAKDGNVVVFDGTGGRLIKDSGKTLSSYLPLAGGTMTGDITFNTKGKGLKWTSSKNNNNDTLSPYMGYCTSSGDGTFVIGSLLGTTYQSGLALGGSSGNLLWKGAQVLTSESTINASKVSGTVASADKANKDASGNTITSTYATKTEVNAKANSATTLSGYGITDAYTKSQSDSNFVGWNRGALDVDKLYNGGMYLVASGTNVPSGSQYGVVLSMPYRKLTGNTIPDYGAQIFIPNGDDNTKPNSMFFRTSLESSWNSWQEVATTAVATTSRNGLMSSTDKAKLDTIAEGIGSGGRKTFASSDWVNNNNGTYTLTANGVKSVAGVYKLVGDDYVQVGGVDIALDGQSDVATIRSSTPFAGVLDCCSAMSGIGQPYTLTDSDKNEIVSRITNSLAGRRTAFSSSNWKAVTGGYEYTVPTTDAVVAVYRLDSNIYTLVDTVDIKVSTSTGATTLFSAVAFDGCVQIAPVTISVQTPYVLTESDKAEIVTRCNTYTKAEIDALFNQCLTKAQYQAELADAIAVLNS